MINFTKRYAIDILFIINRFSLEKTEICFSLLECDHKQSIHLFLDYKITKCDNVTEDII